MRQRPSGARIKCETLKEVAYCMVPICLLPKGVNHTDATPRSRYSLCRTLATPLSVDGDDGTGIRGFCAGEKGQDPTATRARRLFILRRGEVALTVAPQGTVVPSTTVLSAVCRG